MSESKKRGKGYKKGKGSGSQQSTPLEQGDRSPPQPQPQPKPVSPPQQQGGAAWGRGPPQPQPQPKPVTPPQQQGGAPWGRGPPQPQPQPKPVPPPQQQGGAPWGRGPPQPQPQPKPVSPPQQQGGAPWGRGPPQAQPQPKPVPPPQQQGGAPWGRGPPQPQPQPKPVPPPQQQGGAPWGRGPPQAQHQGGGDWRSSGPPQPQEQAVSQPQEQGGGDRGRKGEYKEKSQNAKTAGKSKGSAAEVQPLPPLPRIFAPKKSGKQIEVYTNFFRLVISNPDITVHHYDITFEPDKPKYLLRSVWNKFCSMMFPNRIVVFDGMKNAFSKGSLTKEKSCSGTVTVFNSENNREKEFKVEIKEVSLVSFSIFKTYTEEMLRMDKLKVLPEKELTVLDIIMRNWALENLKSSGRSFFAKKDRRTKEIQLSDKLDLHHGYFQSAFLGYRPYLNFDIAHKAFYRDCSVLDILHCFKDRYRGLNLDEMNHFLRTVKVEYQLPNDPSTRRVFTVNELVKDARQQTFEKEDGSKMTVAQFFAKEKKCELRNPDLPLLWVGSRQKSIYLPMEFCRIVPDQVFKGQMDSFETRQMVRSATSDARQRRQDLMDTFRKVNFANDFMKEFGLSVSGDMERVTARVLDAPDLKTSRMIRVNEGVWRIRDFMQAASVPKWCILNLDNRTSKQSVFNFQQQIKNKGTEFNMQIGDPSRSPLEAEASFAGLKKAFSQLKDMDIVFVVISEAKGVYSKVKTICETQEGILTQCVKSRTISQDPRKLSTTVENILLKVNAKLGGTNHCLDQRSKPVCLNGYVMVVGADVTHPSPGSKIPSVAAVAVSCDEKAFQYGISMRVQKGEMIQDLEEIMKKHLRNFKNLRGNFPEKILIFRDGVSEGEFDKVVNQEMGAIKRACVGLCNPKITLIVVQKRHHTRLYPTSPKDEVGKNFNVPVGTCVDTDIVHPRDLDFYLVSHASILGTARPTRYRLLYDDNKITDDELERLTFYLCHLFSRCNRSVSYPAPTYNAHLAAFRGRAYLEGLQLPPAAAGNLKEIQEKMQDKISEKHSMFFV